LLELINPYGEHIVTIMIALFLKNGLI